MITRIEVISTVPDTRVTSRKKNLQNLGLPKQSTLTIIDVYSIAKDFSEHDLKKIGSMLSNPVTQKFFISTQQKPQISITAKFDWAIEVGFLPGVTDNVAHTTREEIEDFFKVKFNDQEDIYTSQLTLLTGKVSKKRIDEIASLLYNPLIQRVSIKSFSQYKKDSGMDFTVPQVKINKKPQVLMVDLNISDEELTKLGKEGVKNSDGVRNGPLALDLLYMKTIQAYFKKLGKKPTDIEIESIAQTWSEHCKHTIFANPIDTVKEGIFKHYIKRATDEIRKKRKGADICVSVFTDNSGAIAFDDEYLVTHKVETHNTPSSLDPFGGAITGIVGVNRDTLGFGLGAKPVANFYGFCVANPEIDKPLYKGKKKTQKMLSSQRIMNGVIAGINAGGNQSGIPTPQGFIYFHEGYRGKPLVCAGTIGLIPRKIKGKLSHIKKAKKDDYIVVIGGRVGKDGIHGATFSSEALDEGSPVTAVQIGDPITQKKLSDAIIYEARDMLLYDSITDNGAGGLSCSVAEMAKESGGCEVDLEKVPLKYPGLEPWEIWISESQERMTLAVPPEKWPVFEDLMNRRGVEATVIGRFTDSGTCVVKYNNKVIMNLDMDFLHNGLPKETQQSMPIEINVIKPKFREPKNLNTVLKSMLERPNITSFSFITQQYDHIVQAGLVLPPLQGRGRVNAEASVFRPTLTSNKGVVMSHGMYPTYSDINPYNMAAASIDTSIRNAVSVGANPNYIALLDNFCWCSPDDPRRLGQLKEASKACFDYAVSYETPYISGKDSMYNDFKGYDAAGNPVKISIPPTLLISSIGVIENAEKVVSLDVKNPGDLVYVLGETLDELGGSEYANCINKNNSFGAVPHVNVEKNKKMYTLLYKAIQKDMISSSISLTRGGLGVGLAKMAIGGFLGLTIDLEKVPKSTFHNDETLFSESQGRIVVTITKDNKQEFEKIMKGIPYAYIGKVTKKPQLIIEGKNNNIIIDENIDTLFNSYTKTFKGY